jgi:catechol 2,3-dioxygenase-like lactoylglutathione lyase family enzyme
MPFTKTIPILRILDEAKAKEFYVDFLGFKIDWGNRATGALFMQVSLDERDSRLAQELMIGERTLCAARHFRMTPGRVSQLRREYCAGWARFHGEGVVRDHVPFLRHELVYRVTDAVD